MADERHVPKGVSLETLFEILSGWSAVGAAAEPQYTADVEELTGIADAVRRQTRFLEDVGVLEPEGQKHRLTDRGEQLASAIDIDEPQRAREPAREVLSDWPLTDEIRGVVRENPVPEDELVELVATLADEDAESSRVRSGVSTLLELLEWADLLERDASGRYRLPDDAEPPTIETPEVPPSPRPDPHRADLSSGVREPVESVSPRTAPDTSELTAAIESDGTKSPRPEPSRGELTRAVDSAGSTVPDSEPSLEEGKSAAESEEKASSGESETVPVSAEASEESPLGEPETTEKREGGPEQPEGPTEAEAEATVEVEPTDEGPGAEEAITGGHPEPEATSEQAEPAEENPETAESKPESAAEEPTESGELDVDLSAADEADLTEVGERLSDAIVDVERSEEGIELRIDDEGEVDVEALGDVIDGDTLPAVVDSELLGDARDSEPTGDSPGTETTSEISEPEQQAEEPADQALQETAEAAREAADAARDAAERAATNESDSTGDSVAAEPHALSLGVDLDADPNDLEALVEGIRRGLLEGEEGDDSQ